MRRAWILGAAALLTACGATDTASCSPCPGPGFVAEGLPASDQAAVVRTCVADEPCQTVKLSRAPQFESMEFVRLAHQDWASYDGKLITVTVRIGDRRWHGGAGFTYVPAGDGTCSCSALVARVTFLPGG